MAGTAKRAWARLVGSARSARAYFNGRFREYIVPSCLPDPPSSEAEGQEGRKLTFREELHVLRETFNVYLQTWRPPRAPDKGDEEAEGEAAAEAREGGSGEDASSRAPGRGKEAVWEDVKVAVHRRMVAYRDGLKEFADAFARGYSDGHANPMFVDGNEGQDRRG